MARLRFGWLALLAVAAPAWGTQVLSVTQDRDTVARYDRIEIAIDLDAAYDNPYDPAQADVEVEFTTPGGLSATVPAFWFEPYARSLSGGLEVFTPDGPGQWRARYAPMEPGSFSYVVRVRDAGGEAFAGPFAFVTGPATSRGFVRVNPANARYFVFDDGTSYVPLGVNIAWTWDLSGGYAYDAYVDSMADSGGNWTRLWMSAFGEGTTLEWGAWHPTGYYAGLGRYSQQAAAKLDEIFEHAEGRGVAIQLVLHQHSQFETGQWSSWYDNPYNAANGGPCPTSADYFTNRLAKDLASRLHRYIGARYAAYRSLLAFEIWNEVDLIQGVGPSLITPWSWAAAADLRAADPQDHLVTTSYSMPYVLPVRDFATWDYNNRHMYSYGSDLVGQFLNNFRRTDSPLLMAEFGIDAGGQFNASDPLGVNMHNGIWLALSHGYAGGAMNWWWDDYIAPNRLWFHNRAPALFVAGEDMTRFADDAAVSATGGGRVLDAAGIAARDEEGLVDAWLWVHDPRSEWWGPQVDFPGIGDAWVTLAGLAPDRATRWRARVIDSWGGAPEVDLAGVSDGADRVSFLLPRFARDVAVKFHAEAEPDRGDDDSSGPPAEGPGSHGHGRGCG